LILVNARRAGSAVGHRSPGARGLPSRLPLACCSGGRRGAPGRTPEGSAGFFARRLITQLVNLSGLSAPSAFEARPTHVPSEEGVAQGREGGPFLVVLAVAVAAGGGLVEKDLIVAHGAQLGGHLAGVAGMHAIVAARRGEQDRRVVPPGHGLVIG